MVGLTNRQNRGETLKMIDNTENPGHNHLRRILITNSFAKTETKLALLIR
jgi:hypothetical protein